MAKFTLEIVFGGLFALVQSSDKQGVMVLAPKLLQGPAHDIKITTSTDGLTWSIPSGYELSIWTDGQDEIPIAEVVIDKDVEINVPTQTGPKVKKAILLDSSAIVAGNVEKKYLAPIKEGPVPEMVAFRARLRSGQIDLVPQAANSTHRAMSFSYLGTQKVDRQRLVGQAVYRKTDMEGDFIELRFASLKKDGTAFVLRLPDPGTGKVLSIRIANEEDPWEFCKLAGDAKKLEHSVAAFGFLDQTLLPIATVTYNYEGDKYITLEKACEQLMGMGGKEPAICYIVKMPATVIEW